jgi:quercetin dioxygenase-like cupin family protein
VKAKNPYKEVEKNLLERTVYESAGPGGTRIELRDLFVSPGAMVEKVSLPGPAILQVLSGEGKMTTAEKATELTVGTTLTLGQDTSCALESRGITPLVLRAHIVVP